MLSSDVIFCYNSMTYEAKYSNSFIAMIWNVLHIYLLKYLSPTVATTWLIEKCAVLFGPPCCDNNLFLYYA